MRWSSSLVMDSAPMRLNSCARKVWLSAWLKAGVELELDDAPEAAEFAVTAVQRVLHRGGVVVALGEGRSPYCRCSR